MMGAFLHSSFFIVAGILKPPLFKFCLRGGRQGAFDCELQFAISNALCFSPFGAPHAHWICSLSPQFAPFTGRCSFRRLQPPHAFDSSPGEPKRPRSVRDVWQPTSCRLYLVLYDLTFDIFRFLHVLDHHQKQRPLGLSKSVCKNKFSPVG